MVSPNSTSSGGYTLTGVRRALPTLPLAPSQCRFALHGPRGINPAPQLRPGGYAKLSPVPFWVPAPDFSDLNFSVLSHPVC